MGYVGVLEGFRGVNEDTIGRLWSFSGGNVGANGVFNGVNEETMEVLGALR